MKNEKINKILIGMLLMSSAAQAGGLVSAMSSSVQLNVDAARTTATRTVKFLFNYWIKCWNL